MSPNRLVDGFAAYLGPIVAPVPVGASRPGSVGELPAVALGFDDLEQALTAIGASPAPFRTGALPVEQGFDLADPTVTFPDGETVDLLSDDRLRLHFPFGPVVAAGGESVATLAPGDLTVAVDGVAQTVVATPPDPTEVQGLPEQGEIVFGQPLPPNGSLQIEFFVGQWEVDTARYQGELTVEAWAADDAGMLPLTEQIVDALDRATLLVMPGLHRLRPRRLGPVATAELAPGDGPGPATARNRTLTYRFDFEVETPTLGTGGGLIDTVEVDGFLQDPLGPVTGPEEFEVSR